MKRNPLAATLGSRATHEATSLEEVDDPIWLLWIMGPVASIIGILVFRHRESFYRFVRHRMDASPYPEWMKVDPFGDSRSVAVPAVFFILWGIFALVYASSRTFQWGWF